VGRNLHVEMRVRERKKVSLWSLNTIPSSLEPTSWISSPALLWSQKGNQSICTVVTLSHMCVALCVMAQDFLRDTSSFPSYFQSFLDHHVWLHLHTPVLMSISLDLVYLAHPGVLHLRALDSIGLVCLNNS
jgi:hypothetical protein